MSGKKLDKKSNINVIDREDRKVKKPKKFKVVMLNDDYTPMILVTHILEEIFHKSSAEATRLMLDVHTKGKGIAGVYSKEIAETKSMTANSFARDLGYPFKTSPRRRIGKL